MHITPSNNVDVECCTGMDTSDLPPPYTVVDEPKASHLAAGQLPGSVSLNQQGGQTLPPSILSVCPPAPPGYETVAYYPVSSGDTAVFLQPQPQQLQPQVITVVQQIQPTNVQGENRHRSWTTDVCLLCCMGLCCCCPCILVGFI